MPTKSIYNARICPQNINRDNDELTKCKQHCCLMQQQHWVNYERNKGHFEMDKMYDNSSHILNTKPAYLSKLAGLILASGCHKYKTHLLHISKS